MQGGALEGDIFMGPKVEVDRLCQFLKKKTENNLKYNILMIEFNMLRLGRDPASKKEFLEKMIKNHKPIT